MKSFIVGDDMRITFDGVHRFRTILFKDDLKELSINVTTVQRRPYSKYIHPTKIKTHFYAMRVEARTDAHIPHEVFIRLAKKHRLLWIMIDGHECIWDYFGKE